MARRLTILAPLAGLLALQGCAHQGPQKAAAPAYAFDFQGAAKQCTVPKEVKLQAGQTANATIAVTNDGGWCGFYVAQEGPAAYSAGLLTVRASHGKVYIHPVGDQTRIDYTPDPGFGGTDSFEVKLIPGDPVLHVAVTVQGPPAPPAPPPAPAPEPKHTTHHVTHTKKK